MLPYIIIGVVIVVGMYFFSRQALHCHKQQFRTTDAIYQIADKHGWSNEKRDSMIRVKEDSIEECYFPITKLIH